MRRELQKGGYIYVYLSLIHLEEGMATHSSILAWRIPMEKGAWWARVHGLLRVGHDWATKPHTWQILVEMWRKTTKFCKGIFLQLKKKKKLAENSTFRNKDHGIWSHHFKANWREIIRKQRPILFPWAPKSLGMVTAAMKLKKTKRACFFEGKLQQT